MPTFCSATDDVSMVVNTYRTMQFRNSETKVCFGLFLPLIEIKLSRYAVLSYVSLLNKFRPQVVHNNMFWTLYVNAANLSVLSRYLQLFQVTQLQEQLDRSLWCCCFHVALVFHIIRSIVYQFIFLETTLKHQQEKQ